MAFLLPDDILNNLVCSICRKYLSCGPTKIHQDGRISCGRCNTNITTSAKSLYDKVVQYSLFPCVNRYQGCNKLVQYKNVAQHENICKSTAFSCFICTSNKSKYISLPYLIGHYQTVHENNLLKEPIFLIDPNLMSENVYLYCDNHNNCIFFIEVRCRQDRIFLNAYVSGQQKVVQRFLLNDIVLEPNRVMLCSVFGDLTHNHFEVNVTEMLDAKTPILCKFLYTFLEKNIPVIETIDLNIEMQSTRVESLRKLPKVYLDRKIFPGDSRYVFSPCGSQLINSDDEVINLKCGCCDTYFWNIFDWKKTDICGQEQYFLYCKKFGLNTTMIICWPCFKSSSYDPDEFEKKIPPVFKLRFCCRYGCKSIFYLWDLRIHEQGCELNTEKNAENFVEKCFDENLYETLCRFVNGNIIESFKFYVAFYPSHQNNYPEVPNLRDITSTEKIIYLVTDDGLKCKVYYKFIKGRFCVRVNHEYDQSTHLVTIRNRDSWFSSYGQFGEEIITFNTSEYFSIAKWQDSYDNLKSWHLVSQEKTNIGISLYIKKTLCLIITIKKLSNCNIVL